ncbi:glycosyltransferase [Methylobacterium brachiatum]
MPTRTRKADNINQTPTGSQLLALNTGAVDVFCVYGPSYTEQIISGLIPALSKQSNISVKLHLLNYDSNTDLLNSISSSLEIVDWSNQRPDKRIGFGEGVNILFNFVKPQSCFVVANPDTIPTPTAVKILVDTILSRNAGIVEGRQWPFEHPKEYEPETLQTPWASGAFFACNSAAFTQVEGFDELFFLYNEDVDISWRVRMAGWSVLYQPEALIHHYTGLGKYQKNVFYLEHFYSIRNFFLLGYKFWGEPGERATIGMARSSQFPKGFVEKAISSYSGIKPLIRTLPPTPPDKWIKILNLNQYHNLRDR